MGADSRRPPLPAPTDISSSAVGDTTDDLATDISRRTDRTSYTIPEDGHPVTISTKKIRDQKDLSHTSLLIEYFEASKSGPGVHSRPSVRVRVTPSGSKKNRTSSDHIQVTEVGKNRKPSYTRRISLPKPDEPLIPGEFSDSGSSDRHPVEIEVLQNVSDLSQYDQLQNPLINLGSDVSSMPPESTVGSKLAFRDPRETYTSTEERQETVHMATLKAPTRQRSLSRERLVQKALKKVQEGQSASRESSGKHKSSSRRSSRSEGSHQYVVDEVVKSPKSRSTKYRDDDHLGSGIQASEISALSDRSAGQTSMRSGVSGASGASSINNPKLLNAVEDAIKRLILPELTAVKEEQARQKNRMKFDDITRDSMAPVGSRENLRVERRVSKSSSSPNIAVKPAIITDDRGVIVPSETIRSKKSRQSSRGSEKSHDTAIREESTHRRSSREKRHSGKEAAAVAVVGGGLTYAALRHHDSISSLGDEPVRERRKKRSKSRPRSRKTSVSESIDDSPRKGKMAKGVPPLPMQSALDTGTELTHATRESIQSVETDRPVSQSSVSNVTPIREIREVSRGSARHVVSPEPSTPTRSMTPNSTKRGLGTYHDNSGDFSPLTSRSLKSEKSEKTLSEKARLAGLAAAGLGGAAFMHHHEKSRELTPNRNTGPAQGAVSYQDDIEDQIKHERIRSIKSGGSLTPGRQPNKKMSNISIDSISSTQTTNLASSKKRPEGISLERGFEVLPEDMYSPATPTGEVDQWLAHEHEENERYRHQLEEESQIGSSLVDHRRDTRFTDDSMMYEDRDKALVEGQNYLSVGANPEYVSTPVAVESAVASLHDPSLLSSIQSSQMTGSAGDHPGSTNRNVNTAGSGLQNPASSKERWEAIRDQAIANVRLTAGTVSPRQSDASGDRYPVMGASALPLADEPMPEIGHGLDDASDVTTNPSIIQGPIGGLNHGDRSHWPYEPTPITANGKMSSRESREDDRHDKNGALLTAGAGAGAAAVGLGLAAANAKKASQERGSTPNGPDLGASVEQVQDEQWRKRSPGQQQYGYSPATGKIDEGYMSGQMHGGEMTPDPYAEEDPGYEDGEFDDENDPFTSQKHMRHESGMSHGMASPLYDSATGKGIDRIQSKDIVALMDHLTVRDAQRNARDTEILVTLVRSAAETRNQFDDMKKFIAEQDRLIKENTNRGVENTIRAVGGPRPYPSKSSPGVQRRQYTDEAEATKKKNVFSRAIRNLGGKSGKDLAKIEGMLMQILDEMEDLKQLQGGGSSQRASTSIHANTQSTNLDSYENLRAQEPDPGYEPEGRAETGSDPNHSDHLSVPSSKQLAMHSGYDGRRPSDGHRISTVLEEGESGDELEYGNEDRLLTPAQEVRRGNSVPGDTSPDQSGAFRAVEETAKAEKSRKHKSNTSSIFSGFPKISRWSKTTTSSAPDPETARNSIQQKGSKPYSQHSRSDSNPAFDYDDDDDYDMVGNDRPRSQQSSTRRGQTPRSPSPLIPEDRHSMDDPKYQVHRNSLNLQHPQPRPGPTHRHQTYLESQAVSYENPPTPEADHWGNTPALALNRNRYSGGSHNPPDLSPVYDKDEDAYSQHSASEQAHNNRGPSQQSQGPPRPPKVKSDEGPLIPPKISLNSTFDNSLPPPQPIGFGYSSPFSNSGMHIASPLEPIEEVRYSLETDNASLKQGRNNDLTPSPRPTAMQSVRRNITGPRDMPPRRGSPGGNLGTVRRKPVAARSPVQSLESYRGDSDEESETF
ncbi:hypothetical protein E2P81_ATG05503 [Venturia nashicola]|uniref:Uncharacterized protein n=1 Tax=Venturia nashicola TaxID=86259 RepID=A0A4Z1NXQ1_9PEZI|nr:hypothetical protein E6O75_ATG05638 [Venturia nashicola]TLD32527.1 hypothetical protein E2P81_ATG05503 [Venturia nashicola]